MAVSTRWKLLAGLSAAMLALTACGDSGSNNGDVDGGGAGNGGNANAGNGDTSGNGTQGQNEGGTTAMPVADLDDNVAGKGCTGDADCKGEGATCASMLGGIMGFGAQPAEGGYCTGTCDDDSNCGAGGVCAGAIGGFVQGTCQKACDGDSDCRTSEGYICLDGSIMIPEGGLPIPAGDGGMSMMPPIPPQPKTCAPKPATDDLADGVVGKACATDAECSGGKCNTTVMQGGIAGMGGMTVTYPGGYCSGSCLTDDNCGSTGQCAGAISFGPINNPGNCFEKCTTTAECGREGYRCAAAPRLAIPGAPAPAASGEVCQPGPAPTATATITSFAGAIMGSATFSTTDTGAQAVITLTNCPGGDYAFRIHTGAACGSFGAPWDGARGTISQTITCTGNTGTVTVPRSSADAASKWSLDEAPATDVGGHTLLVYASPIGDAAPLACGAITNVP